MKKLDWTTIFISSIFALALSELWSEIKKRNINVREPASIK